MSSESIFILPVVGSSKPAIMRRVVVLPHPDGPSRVTSSPGSMVKFAPSTATTSRPDCGSLKILLTPSSVTDFD